MYSCVAGNMHEACLHIVYIAVQNVVCNVKFQIRVEIENEIVELLKSLSEEILQLQSIIEVLFVEG